MEIEIVRTGPQLVLAKVTVPGNEVYARAYYNQDESMDEEADPPLTKMQVQKDWLSDRSRFHPYDEATGSFFGITETGEVAAQVESGSYGYSLWTDTDTTHPLHILSHDSMRSFSFTPRETLDLLELLQTYQTELEELADDQ